MAELSFHKSIVRRPGVVVNSGMLAPGLQHDSGNNLPPEKVDRLARLVGNIQRQLTLEKLAIFVRVYESGVIVQRLPLHAFAKISIGLKSNTGDNRKTVNSINTYLGCLATDHVGYASFDLNVIRDIETLVPLVEPLPENTEPTDLVAKLDLTVLPFGDELLAIDALAEGQVNTSSVVLRYQLEQAWLNDRLSDPPLPSLQQPDILDWRLSPGSFALSPNQLIGESGCEDLYPSNLSSHQFHFHQAIRRIDASNKLNNPFILGFRYGYILEYRSQWFPVGHSLGKVLYSLPLAPGEEINLAIIDWSRSDIASRTEATKLAETLNHDQLRDRTISEVVYASVREKQSGSSMMGGLGLSLLAPVGDSLLGGSLGLGAASTNSSGTRNISADTTQQLSDGFHQASTAIRELRSTVITQASQVESGRFETRKLANYNHCHTLTILYYEVLRHFRVLTSLVIRRPVLFVDFGGVPLLNFIDELVIHAHRLILETALLDARHLSGFEALEKKRAANAALKDAIARFNASDPIPTGANLVFTKLYVLFETGDDGTDTGNIFMDLMLKDGRVVRCRQIIPPRTDDEFSFDTDRDDWIANTIDAFVLAPETPTRWGEIRGVVVHHRRTEIEIVNNIFDSWKLQAIRIAAATEDKQATVLLDTQVDQVLNGSSTTELPVHTPPADSPMAPPPQLTDFISSSDLASVDSLIDHLNAYKFYYNAAITIGADPVERGETFKKINVSGTTTLFDVIENKVVASTGRELAFPLSEVGDQIIRAELKMTEDDDSGIDFVAAEDLISIPTRGVFAEGKLGYCSTCEKIDNTRFWDFQTSPIPGQAPQISPLDTSSRFQRPEGLSPTAFPASIVNITNPPSAPDPVALGAALQVLGSGSLFRDMSGSAGLASFLGSIVQGTTSAVTAFAGDKRQSDLIEQIKNIPGLTPEQKTALMSQVLGGKTSDSSSSSGSQPVNQPTNSPDVPAKPSTTPQQGRVTKPVRPNPAPPAGNLAILVSVDTLGIIPDKDLELTMVVQPFGKQIQTVGPTVLKQGFLQAVLKDEGIRSGNLSITVSWLVRVEIESNPFDFGSDDEGNRLPIAAGMKVSLYAETTYVIPADQQAVRFKVQPKTETRKIRSKSLSAAEVKAKADLKSEFGGDFELLKATTSVGFGVEGGTSTSNEQEVEWVLILGRNQLEIVPG